ncbi:hypothetical protein [Xanthomonas citri]|uniref:hypothetical protein n=1 Tax=Xanthomonas citri TaxID=346 RepID=UPI0009C35A47|nr:hypothetical protein [Xanthomonas citri]AMV05658.1 hypothetical protein AC028_01500 [Xanthomonas citri pv. aurantifolii]ARE57771.1 hypothetical protein TP45_16495 [Xanthomonas citri pv. aurantifolii]
MTRQITKLVIGAGMMVIATQVGASKYLIDMQGAAGKRVNVYASDAIEPPRFCRRPFGLSQAASA